MALLIDATGENVSITDAASIRDLTAWTMLFWWKPATTAVASRIYQKPNTGGGNGREISRNTSILLLFSERATDALQIEAPWANFSAYSLDIWLWLAITADQDDANNCRFYLGHESTAAAEPSAYNVRTAGSGAIVSDDTQAAIVGNRLASGGDRPMNADVAHFSLYGRIMTLTEINEQRVLRSPASDCRVYHEYGQAQGVGSQIDWSGNNNHGTVNGATVSDHVPVRSTVPRRFFLMR